MRRTTVFIALALLLVTIIDIEANNHAYTESSSSALNASGFHTENLSVWIVESRRTVLTTTFNIFNVELLPVSPARIPLTTMLSSRTFVLIGVSSASSTSLLGRIVSTFNSRTSTLLTIVPSSGSHVAVTFNTLGVEFYNMSPPRIELLEISGYAAPKYMLAGYDYSIIARVSEPVNYVDLHMLSSEGTLLSVTVHVPNRSYTIEGSMAKYVKSVKIEKGSIVVNVAISIPWNKSLGNPVNIYVYGINAFGETLSSMSSAILQALSVANASYPKTVAPNQVFNVTLQLTYNGTNFVPPPGTIIVVNGTDYRTDSQGKISVPVRAPSRPGASTITLSITDPANISIPVKIRVTVTPTTTTRTATAYATASTPIQASSTTRTTTQRSTTYVASGGGSLGGTAKSMLLPALLLVTLVFTILIASIVAKLRRRSY